MFCSTKCWAAGWLQTSRSWDGSWQSCCIMWSTLANNTACSSASRSKRSSRFQLQYSAGTLRWVISVKPRLHLIHVARTQVVSTCIRIQVSQAVSCIWCKCGFCQVCKSLGILVYILLVELKDKIEWIFFALVGKRKGIRPQNLCTNYPSWNVLSLHSSSFIVVPSPDREGHGGTVWEGESRWKGANPGFPGRMAV